MRQQIQQGMLHLKWQLYNKVCSHTQYLELMAIRKFLSRSKEQFKPIVDLEQVCDLLELPHAKEWVLQWGDTKYLAVYPICNMMRELYVEPYLAWVEHYICLYENSTSIS